MKKAKRKFSERHNYEKNGEKFQNIKRSEQKNIYLESFKFVGANVRGL